MSRITALILVIAISQSASAQAGKVITRLTERLVVQEGRIVARGLEEVSDDVLKALRPSTRYGNLASHDELVTRLGKVLPVHQEAKALATLRALPLVEQHAVVEFIEIQTTILKAAPDGLRTLEFLSPAGVVQAKIHGEWVGHLARTLHTPDAIAAFTRQGVTEATVAQLFRDAVRKTGKGLEVFWQKWVVPHWDKMLVGGLVLAILRHPEEFCDAAGNVVEKAVRKIADIGVGIIEPTMTGTAKATATTVQNHWYERPLSMTLAVGLIVAGVLLLLRLAARWYYQLWTGQPRQPFPLNQPPMSFPPPRF